MKFTAKDAREVYTQNQESKKQSIEDRVDLMLDWVLEVIKLVSKNKISYKLDFGCQENQKRIHDFRQSELFTYSVMNSPCVFTETGQLLKKKLEELGYTVNVSNNSWFFDISW